MKIYYESNRTFSVRSNFLFSRTTFEIFTHSILQYCQRSGLLKRLCKSAEEKEHKKAKALFWAILRKALNLICIQEFKSSRTNNYNCMFNSISGYNTLHTPPKYTSSTEDISKNKIL